MSGNAAYEIYPVAGGGSIQQLQPSIDPVRSVGIFNSSDRRVYLRFQTGDIIYADPSTTLAFPVTTGYSFDVWTDGQIHNGSAFVDFSSESRAGIFGLANKYPKAIVALLLNNATTEAVLDRATELLIIDLGDGATIGLLSVGVFVAAGLPAVASPTYWILENILHAPTGTPATMKRVPYQLPVAIPSGWAVRFTYTGQANLTVISR